MSGTTTNEETYRVTWAKDEVPMIKLVLRTCGETDTDPHKAIETMQSSQALGYNPSLDEHPNVHIRDLPSPAELLRNMNGQVWVGTFKQYLALKNCMLVAITRLSEQQTDLMQYVEEIRSIANKIVRAINELE